LKKALHIGVFLIFGLNASAQTVTINPAIQIDSTLLKISEAQTNYFVYSSFDNQKPDSLAVSLSTVGTSTKAIRIDFTEKPNVSLVLSSDYKEFDGNYTLTIPLESYELELNTDDFNTGDILMGRIKGISQPIKKRKGTFKIKFEGVFRHIIGKILLKKKAAQKYKILDH
jgi:hypothetical protein